MAGRYLVLVRKGEIELFNVNDFQTGYTSRLHKTYVEFGFSVGQWLSGAQGNHLLYAPPYLYAITPGKLQRVHIREHKEVELVAQGSEIQPSGAAAVVLEPDRTYIAFALSKHFALLVTNRYHKPETGENFELIEGYKVANSGAFWHSPVYQREEANEQGESGSAFWFFVDSKGKLITMEKIEEAPYWRRNTARYQDSLVEGSSVDVSPPCLLDNCLFTAFWNQKAQEGGISRLNLSTGKAKPFSTRQFDSLLNVPPLPYHGVDGDSGVVWSINGGTGAYFVPVQGEAMPLVLQGFTTFQHQHAVQAGQEWVIWVPDPTNESMSQLIAAYPDRSYGRLVGRRLATLPVSWKDAVSLVYLPETVSESPCFLAQAKESLTFIYP